MRHADALFAAERSAEEELRALRNLDSGSLRIGASTTIATYLIPDFLGAFHNAHPGIELYLTSANTRDIADLMIQHQIEIALVEGPINDEGLDSEPVAYRRHGNYSQYSSPRSRLQRIPSL